MAVSSSRQTSAIPRHSAGLGVNQARSLNACQYGTFNLWEGSVRSGKTYVSILGFLLAVAAAGHGGEIVVTGRSIGSIYRNVFKAIEEAPGLAPFKGSVSYRQGAPSAQVMGREVHVIGANDSRAETKIRGMTILLVYVDELTVLPEEYFKQLLARMSLADSRMLATTNPDSPAHWLKTGVLNRLRELKDWRRFHFVMDDNPSLTTAVKERLKAQYTGLWFKRFIEGAWVSAEGAIFDMWDHAKHVIPHAQLPPMQELLAVGVDFGTNNPSTGLLLGRSREVINGRPYSRLVFVDEWRYEGKQQMTGTLSPSQQATLFKTWLHDTPHLPEGNPGLAMKPRFVVVDPAASHFSRELNEVGITTWPGMNAVSYGIGLMASLLSERKLVVSDRCKGFITEAPGYSWDEKAVKEGKDVPVKVADHSLDGGRYAITTTEDFWSNTLDWPVALAA